MCATTLKPASFASLKHWPTARTLAVVGPRLDRQADAFGSRGLAVPHRLDVRRARVSGQGVVQSPDEIVSVVCRKRHESAAHQHKLDLVGAVAEAAELVEPRPGLDVRVVPRPDRPHARGLVACIRLGRVLEVGVGPTGAVDADGSRGGYVRAAVRLGHDGDDGDARGGADGLGAEAREQGCSGLFGDAGDDVYELGSLGKRVAGRGLR